MTEETTDFFSERSAFKRFGGNWSWELGDEEALNIGEAICGEGPGKGFAMYPWVLDRYERVLRLRPGETWLLKRLLKHVWEFDGVVYVSQRKIAVHANISRPTIRAYIARLEELGYLMLVADGDGPDRRKRYDVSGLYAALALCIAADPTSKWAEEHGDALSKAEVQKKCHSAGRDEPTYFDLDFEALEKIVERNGHGRRSELGVW